VSSAVLDASALLAFLRRELGAETVAAALADCSISSVNLAETYSRLVRSGGSLDSVVRHVERLQIPVVAFDEPQALVASSIHSRTRQYGLSLADCACLALGISNSAVVLTADRAWGQLSLGVEIVLIR
jgi:PIN domain nuclease of toxin-antitoxin system